MRTTTKKNIFLRIRILVILLFSLTITLNTPIMAMQKPKTQRYSLLDLPVDCLAEIIFYCFGPEPIDNSMQVVTIRQNCNEPSPPREKSNQLVPVFKIRQNLMLACKPIANIFKKYSVFPYLAQLKPIVKDLNGLVDLPLITFILNLNEGNLKLQELLGKETDIYGFCRLILVTHCVVEKTVGNGQQNHGHLILLRKILVQNKNVFQLDCNIDWFLALGVKYKSIYTLAFSFCVHSIYHNLSKSAIRDTYRDAASLSNRIQNFLLDQNVDLIYLLSSYLNDYTKRAYALKIDSLIQIKEFNASYFNKLIEKMIKSIDNDNFSTDNICKLLCICIVTNELLAIEKIVKNASTKKNKSRRTPCIPTENVTTILLIALRMDNSSIINPLLPYFSRAYSNEAKDMLILAGRQNNLELLTNYPKNGKEFTKRLPKIYQKIFLNGCKDGCYKIVEYCINQICEHYLFITEGLENTKTLLKKGANSTKKQDIINLINKTIKRLSFPKKADWRVDDISPVSTLSTIYIFC